MIAKKSSGWWRIRDTRWTALRRTARWPSLPERSNWCRMGYRCANDPA